MAIYTPTSISPGDCKMMLIHFSNEFPNDDLQGLFRRLHLHSKSKQHHVLASFIDEATQALREEIWRLPKELKELIPPFDSILNLADYPELRKGPLCGSVDGILLCVVEIAAFLGYCEKYPDQVDFNFSNVHLSGLGIGLLASAAISLAPTLKEVARTGAEVVRIAFRLGVVVSAVSQNLDSSDGSGFLDSWAYVLPDIVAEEAQQELDSIHNEEKTPKASRIFISAFSKTSITISGPPSRLKRLFRTSGFFRDRKYVPLPVYGGLCHAKHIYDQSHVGRVIKKGPDTMMESGPHSNIPIFSTCTGRPFIASDAKGLFEQIITEILTQAIRWDNVIEGVIEQANSISASECSVLVFRRSLPANDLLAALKNAQTALDTSMTELIPWISENVSPTEAPRGPMQSKLAIVGMSCRMPGGATDTEKFWDLLEQGLDVHRKIPPDRFDRETHCDTTGQRMNTSHTEYGCFIDEPGLFDAPFFNMSPREALQTDPMQRLILVTAYEALERSGFVPNRTASTSLDRIGTFYGQASDDYREVNGGQEVGTYYIPGGCRAFGPGRINYFFKFSGPSFNIDTACSSSLATIQAACSSLWAGETDTVVAGGTNILTNSDGFAGLSHGHFLSKTPNACKTWDATADGYVRADAVGSVVIKRLEDAEADNDNILGVILSGATNHSAEAVSITHPHAGAQSFLYRKVANQAGIDPLQVNFVEMHGTGTQAGDLTEIESVTNVFAPATKRRNAKQPLHIGAVKANVGHSESAAGVTALIKVMLMLQKNAIPPHVGIKTSINPGFPDDLDQRNVHIPYNKVPWPHVEGQKRLAVVNNFSAAGGNTTVVIEEAPVAKKIGTDPRSTHVVAISAKSKISLKDNIEQMVNYLDSYPETDLADLSYTTTARRHHHNHRVAVCSSDVSQLRKQLNSALESVDSHKPIPATGAPSITFAFTGQGASHKSSNLELFHDSDYFHSQMLYLDSLAQGQGFPSFIPAIDGSFPKDHVHSPVVTQLALTCTQVGLAKYWASLGVKPNSVIGHSLGEYAALHVADVLTASDMIFLVGERARLLEQKCQVGGHKMLAVRASLTDIERIAQDMPYQVACINGPKETVLSGTLEETEALHKALQADGHKCHILDVAFAFHSSQTDPILDDFEELAEKGVVFRPPKLPVMSPLLGKVVFDGKTVNANYMRRATREPVNFQSALENGQKFTTINDKTLWVEIGPHPVCMGFVKSTLSDVNVAAASFRRDDDNWKTLGQSLGALHCAGVQIDWNEYHLPFEKSLSLLDIPTYSWNNKTYWLQYNGDWNLTKGNTYYDEEKALQAAKAIPATLSSNLNTSTVHGIIEENFEGLAGKVVIQSDLMQRDFYAAAWGHKMNGCGVVTSSIHADIAWTIGKYLHEKLKPKVKDISMNVVNLQVSKGLVAKKGTSPQLIRVQAQTENIESGLVDLEWYNVSSEGVSDEEPFACANIIYGDKAEWLSSWIPLTHLVQGRIQDLKRLADEGIANRFSNKMAYGLFAKNLVDYADKYRGMQSVVLHQLEAVADVELSKEKGGTYTVPPFFIDSVAHLAGFVMNVSDAMDTGANFCVTPGWRSMRFAKPLTAGAKYQSYVKMIPSEEDPTVYFGDVYVFQDGAIIGMVGGIQFRQYPRILLNRFFSAPEDESPKSKSAPSGPSGPSGSSVSLKASPAHAQTPSKSEPTKQPATSAETAPATEAQKPVEETPAVSSTPKVSESTPKAVESDRTASLGADSTTAKALALIAKEAELDIADLQDDASFLNLGIDSLLSLVISEKFQSELSVTVSGAFFLEYPTIGDMRSWLEEYYS